MIWCTHSPQINFWLSYFGNGVFDDKFSQPWRGILLLGSITLDSSDARAERAGPSASCEEGSLCSNLLEVQRIIFSKSVCVTPFSINCTWKLPWLWYHLGVICEDWHFALECNRFTMLPMIANKSVSIISTRMGRSCSILSWWPDRRNLRVVPAYAVYS